MPVKFIGKAKITRQGQVTLPFEAREELKLDLNSEVYWYLVDDHLVVVKNLVSTEELAAIIAKKNKKRG
jgi:bifunctional DNA-binding transcriptional regulator/antitoxin component of YhaV-PrlF toxin-antitoxin module